MRPTGMIVLALALTACSGGGATLDSPKAMAAQLNCSSTYAADSTEELGVEAVGKCTFDGETVRLLTFANDEARDNFVKIASTFGGRYVTGSGYAVEVKSKGAEDKARAML